MLIFPLSGIVLQSIIHVGFVFTRSTGKTRGTGLDSMDMS